MTILAFALVYTAAGYGLALNLKGLAERFSRLLGKVSFGLFDGFPLGLYRICGAGSALLGTVMVVTLVVDLLG
ncbi:hypothetical protein [Streptomyces sp. NPDC006879]|uniref:hypothetical protein n=1 Tax=Streptomyces sp. NPDC006879 TaxID=3364767 RepID=UPI0036AF1E3B